MFTEMTFITAKQTEKGAKNQQKEKENLLST